MISKAQLAEALERALAGEWHQAHEIVQRDDQDELSCWGLARKRSCAR